MKLVVLGAALAATALAAATGATAQPTAGNSVSVVARSPSEAIRTYGPDRANRYTLVVASADLDLATSAGLDALRSRVGRGTAMLCDQTADGPQLAGFYDGGARECVATTLSAAESQIARAREAAAAGRPVARLELTSVLALR